MTQKVHVALAADDRYSRALATTGRSVIATLAPGLLLAIWVLDVGIAPENRLLIERSFAAPHVEVHWVEGVRDLVAKLPEIWWFTTAIHARLLIPDLLPPEVHRAVYLDSDTVVERDLGELFALEMNGCAALAVPDTQAPLVGSHAGVPLWFESGIEPGGLNYNSGVMLMDLDVWRAEGIGEAAITCMRDAPAGVVMLDQHAINAVAGHRIGALDPRWNQQGEIFWEQDYGVSLPYDQATVEQLKRDPWIIHFTNDRKPWQLDYVHPAADRWFHYLDQTAYAGWRPPPRPLVKRVVRTAGKKALALAKARGL